MTSAEGAPWTVPREARPYQGHRAGMVTRTIAGAVDSVIVLVVVLVGILSVNGVYFVLDPRGYHVLGTSRMLLIDALLGTAILYLAGSWTVVGRTFGCHLMGLRIVDRRGRSPRLTTALVRAILYVVFPLGLVWCGIGRSRRSLQDLLLGTSVVYDWMPEHRPAPAAD